MTGSMNRYDWLKAVQAARDAHVPCVLVTVTEVVGHSPRDAGAKMVVTAETTCGTIGGGNLEATCLERARELIDEMEAGRTVTASTWCDELTEHRRAAQSHGLQCCGGRVTVLFEPLPVRPSVAIVGAGHVGRELLHILIRHPWDIHLIDSRAERLTSLMNAELDGPGELRTHHAVMPEAALANVPRETHVLVMTHDHAEDFAVLDAILRQRDHFATVGVIGSTAKWRRFEKRLSEEGHAPAVLATVTCPIGDSRIKGKEPALVALSVAADLVPRCRSGVAMPTTETNPHSPVRLA